MPVQQIFVVYNNDDGEMIMSKDGDWGGGRSYMADLLTRTTAVWCCIVMSLVIVILYYSKQNNTFTKNTIKLHHSKTTIMFKCKMQNI